MIPKCHIRIRYGQALCIRQYQAAIVRVEDGVLLLTRRVNRLRFPFDLRRLMVDFIMHLCQELRRRCSEPPPATELERPQMATPIRRAQDCVRVLLELLEGNSSFGRYLDNALARCLRSCIT
jgi:hypothetical protein